MYSTYQRAMSAACLTVPQAAANKRHFIAAMRERIAPENRTDPKWREGRKAYYRRCLSYLENDLAIMERFRL